jgi:hypothetical protein
LICAAETIWSDRVAFRALERILGSPAADELDELAFSALSDAIVWCVVDVLSDESTGFMIVFSQKN